MTNITYIPGEIANAAIDEHGNRKPVTRTHHIFDDDKGKNQQDINKDVYNLINTLKTKVESIGILDLEEIHNNVSLLNNTVENIDSKADTIESNVNNLNNRVQQLELNPSRDSIKHIFITQSAYDALETYEKDTLYLIVEYTSNGSKFGEDTFPLILS